MDKFYDFFRKDNVSELKSKEEAIEELKKYYSASNDTWLIVEVNPVAEVTVTTPASTYEVKDI